MKPKQPLTEEEIKLQAVERYWGILGVLLGRWLKEGGGRRRHVQRLDLELGNALREWLRSHPGVPLPLRRRLIEIHLDLFRNADIARDHFEQENP